MKKKRSAGWRNLRRYILYKPQFRPERGCWSVRIRDSATGRIHKLKVALDLPRSSLPKARKLASQEALRVAQEWLGLKDRLDREMPFAAAVEAFLESRRGEMRANSLRDLALALRGIFTPLFGDRLVGDIKPAEIERALRDRRLPDGRRVSPRTQARLRSHLTNLFRWCRRQGMIESIPTEAMKLPRVRPVRSKVALTEEEALELLRVVREEPPAVWAFVAVSLCTGLRPVTLLRIQQRDVRLEEAGGKIVVPAEKTKTHAAFQIPVCTQLRTLLLEYYNTAGVNAESRLVPLSIQHLRRRLKEAYRRLRPGNPARAGELQQADLRTLRRTFATLLAPKVPHAVLGRLLGHSPTATVTTRYTVPTWQELRQAVEALPSFRAPPCKRAGQP